MKNATKLVVIMDRSGSMSSIKPAMEEVLNGFIAAQKQIPGECSFTLVQFDDIREVPIRNLPLKDVGTVCLTPRNSTALIDALGLTIDEVGQELSAMKEEDRPNKVMIVVVTDGLENASRVYLPHNDSGRVWSSYLTSPNYIDPFSRVREMVKRQSDTYNWQFVFFGANQDAILSAKNLGIDADSAVHYACNADSVKAAGARLNKMSNAYRTTECGFTAKGIVRGLNRLSGTEVTAAETLEWDDLKKKTEEDSLVGAK